MVVVWDTSRAVRGGEVNLVAKAHTDVDICRMRIAEFDDSRYETSDLLLIILDLTLLKKVSYSINGLFFKKLLKWPTRRLLLKSHRKTASQGRHAR